MWLSEQQKKGGDPRPSQAGVVTMGLGEPAVQLDSERRGLKVYSPGGYRWTPRAGQQVLVLKNPGEDPCVVGVRQGEACPASVTIEAGVVDLQGQVTIDGVPLEQYIAAVAAQQTGG